MPTTFTWTNPIQPYSNTPIIISDGNGANSMVFTGIYEPAKLPELINHRHVKISKTRPWIGGGGAVNSGYRIFASFGSGPNQKDLKLDLSLVTPNALAQLQAYSDGSPGVFCISIDGTGTYPSSYSPVIYLCMFKDNGLIIKNYDFNQRAFTAVSLDLYIINQTTSVTFS